MAASPVDFRCRSPRSCRHGVRRPARCAYGTPGPPALPHRSSRTGRRRDPSRSGIRLPSAPRHPPGKGSHDPAHPRVAPLGPILRAAHEAKAAEPLPFRPVGPCTSVPRALCRRYIHATKPCPYTTMRESPGRRDPVMGRGAAASGACQHGRAASGDLEYGALRVTGEPRPLAQRRICLSDICDRWG